MDIVTGKGCLYKNDEFFKTKPILIKLTTTNPCGNTLLDHSGRRNGYAIREAANVTIINTRSKKSV